MNTVPTIVRSILPVICSLLAMFSPTIGLALPSNGKIITCTGTLVEYPEFISIPSTDQQIEIIQTPQRSDFRWRAIGRGALNFDQRTNGPIYPDGTTVNANGDGVIYIAGLDGLKIVSDSNGVLTGSMTFVRQTDDGLLYSLVWQFDRCERTKRRIDSREALVWSAQDILDAYIIEQNSKIPNGGRLFAQGDGIKVSTTLRSVGVHLFFIDEIQRVAALEALIKDRLVLKRGRDYVAVNAINRQGVKIFSLLGGATEGFDSREP